LATKFRHDDFNLRIGGGLSVVPIRFHFSGFSASNPTAELLRRRKAGQNCIVVVFTPLGPRKPIRPLSTWNEMSSTPIARVSLRLATLIMLLVSNCDHTTSDGRLIAVPIISSGQKGCQCVCA
jgi:hypothetical protein